MFIIWYRRFILSEMPEFYRSIFTPKSSNFYTSIITIYKNYTMYNIDILRVPMNIINNCLNVDKSPQNILKPKTDCWQKNQSQERWTAHSILQCLCELVIYQRT
mgnify:CR=1 FL=1